MKQKWADDKANGYKTKKRLLWRRKDNGETFETNDYPRYLPFKKVSNCTGPCCHIKSKYTRSVWFPNHCSFQEKNPWFENMSKKYVLIAVDGKPVKTSVVRRRRRLSRSERWAFASAMVAAGRTAPKPKRAIAGGYGDWRNVGLEID